MLLDINIMQLIVTYAILHVKVFLLVDLMFMKKTMFAIIENPLVKIIIRKQIIL